MSLEAKQATLKQLDQAGKGQALFTLWDTEDLDGDISRKGMFGNQQEPWLLPHHLWTTGAPPLGRGIIRETSEGAIFDFQLNMELQSAKDWLAHLRFDLAQGSGPKQAWSYGYRVLPDGFTPRPGRKGRELHALPSGHPGVLVVEVSPVTAAAQPRSRTLMAKGDGAPLSPRQLAQARAMHDRCQQRGALMREIADLEERILQEQARGLYASFLERERYVGQARVRR
jgi:hypothetical protein